MNLQQLYYFKTTAELEHYTHAAQELHISQSCLSHSINDLEQELGVSLFLRQGRNVKLTTSGAFFLDYVTRALDTLDEGKIRLQDFISSDTGTIRIGHFSSLSDFVPYMISRFFTETGHVRNRFKFVQGSSVHLEQQLFEGKTDMAIMTPIIHPDVETRKIGEHRTVLIVSHDHPLAHQDSVDLTTLGDETFVTYQPQCQIRKYFDSIFAKVGIDPPIAFEAVDDPIIQGAVASNLGIALVAESAGTNNPDLHMLTIENDIPSREIHACWMRDRYMTPAVKGFLDFICQSDMLLDEFKNRHNTEE